MAAERFYVYELIDPRDGAVFYVGKGQGGRAGQHLRDALAGRVDNAAKHARICSILAADERPAVFIAGHFGSEDEALDHEASRIEAIGLENLTNILPRGYAAESAERILRRCIAVARRDIERAQSPALVEFAHETIEVAEVMLEAACPA